MSLDFDCSFDTFLSLSAQNISDEYQLISGNKRHEFKFSLIDGRKYLNDLALLEADVLFNIVRKHWMLIETSVIEDDYVEDVHFMESRTLIANILKLFRHSQNLIDKQVNVLLKTVQRWNTIDDRVLFKLTSFSVKTSNLLISVYYHQYLEMQWVMLCLQQTNMQDNFGNLLKDLVTISYTLYKKNKNTNNSAFVCSCMKSLWLLLQYFGEQYQIDFWAIFNKVVNNLDEVFVLWLLHDVNNLQGYDTQGIYVGCNSGRVKENFVLIELVLKSMNVKCNCISKDNNSLLLKTCSTIYPLLNYWWVQNPKSEPYQTLWEIFNKHLNVCFDAKEDIDSSGNLMEIVLHISVMTQNSFEYFLFMLKEHLRKYPNRWGRIKGRIYSKLSNNKISGATRVGLYNIGLLFLTLAQVVNINEISEKLLSLLQLKEDEVTPIVIHIHMCLIILHVQRGQSIETVSAQLVKLVQEDIICNRNKYDLMCAYINGFDSVLNASTNYYLKQHLLIGSWVSKYIMCSPFSDLCYFLNILLTTVKCLRKDCAWVEWEPVLKEHVLPSLKSIATTESCPSQVGTLAALIDSNPASENLIIFTSDAITTNVVSHFIISLLEDVTNNYFTIPKHHETAILHAWVRCCLLNCDSADKLSENVAKVNVLCEIFPSERTNNPLCSFIKSLSKTKREDINSRELCEQCFGRVDSWITPYFTSPQSEASVVHIYTPISLLFFSCSSILYNKNRSNCLLNRLVNLFLLSTDILMGKTPHTYIVAAVQRTWHLFMNGIYALDGGQDAYIDRTLRDMVTRYIPLLTVNNSPIPKCFNNEKLSIFILERISHSFLLNSSRCPEVNTTKALKIIELLLENTSHTRLILKCSLPGIFEVILFQNNKSVAIDLVKSITSCNRSEELTEYIKSAFIGVTEKYLAFHTHNYFKFAGILVKIMPSDMRKLVSSIKKQVVEVERMRGVGYDNILRQGLNRLETLLS